MRKVVIASMLGNGLEWYDYALYGHMAFIISKLFFPLENESVQLLATFGVFAVGFVFRPLGAVLFGWIGDAYGRRTALVIAILMMAIPTGAIGILPTYEHIGIWAPIFLTLIRVFQGLSLGGEFSGSIVYVVEHAPEDKRALAGSASLASLMIGFLCGSLASMAAVGLLPTEDFESWGWRVPFLFGVVIGLIGLDIRSSCEESPTYQQAKAEGRLSQTPVRHAFSRHKLPMLQGFAMYLTVTMPFYLLSIYLISYTQKELGLIARDALLINAVAMIAMLITTVFSAYLSDRIGRRKLMMAAAAILFVSIYALFEWMQVREFWAILFAQAIFGAILGLYMGPVPAVLVELFPTELRYTGMALSYNFSAALFGGTAPMVCQWLIQQTGSPLSVAYYVMLCTVFSLIALYSYHDRWRESLR